MWPTVCACDRGLECDFISIVIVVIIIHARLKAFLLSLPPCTLLPLLLINSLIGICGVHPFTSGGIGRARSSFHRSFESDGQWENEKEAFVDVDVCDEDLITSSISKARASLYFAVVLRFQLYLHRVVCLSVLPLCASDPLSICLIASPYTNASVIWCIAYNFVFVCIYWRRHSVKYICFVHTFINKFW